MIRLKESILVEQSLDYVFRYTIVFTKTAIGTQIDYQADIRFHWFANMIF